MYTYANPVFIRYGRNCLGSLSQLVQKADAGTRTVLCLTRGGDFLESSAYRTVLDSLSTKKVLIRHFERSNPDIEDLYELHRFLSKETIGLILAIGGGSVLDLAKSIRLLICQPQNSVQEMKTLIEQKRFFAPLLENPLICIPTTAGTGAEVTPWATIWDKAASKKHSLEHPNAFATMAIVDPALTDTLPVHARITFALDALSHAVEAYWAVKTNPVSRALALEAVSLFVSAADDAARPNASNTTVDALSHASLLAGLAFSNTKTTACHSISYPLTLRYRVPHGIGAAITLGSMMKINEASMAEPHRLIRAFGETSAHACGERIQSIAQKAGIAFRLSEYGISLKDIRSIASEAFTKGRMDNNPHPMDENTVASVLQKLL